MQFNSYLFILCFLPIFVLGYFWISKIGNKCEKIYLIVSGLLFFCFGDTKSVVVLCSSIIVNYVACNIIIRSKRRIAVVIPVILNICLLLFFKYINFAVGIVNQITKQEIATLELLLPLGISFFTFQQIMYLVDLYRGEIESHTLLNYLTYILYFPKLTMGPLVGPNNLISQIESSNSKCLDVNRIACGLKMFSLGLFKKVAIADTFAKAVDWGFSNPTKTTAGDLFLITLFYTLQIYFDFSGYSDMAIGISRMINIDLPQNFDSPYKSVSVRDFWKRWHMSLTSFLTKYIFFPLGGSRKGILRTFLNIGIVFLVSGIWHGANWTFILWGVIYGVLQIVERILDKRIKNVFQPIMWIYTMIVVNLLWLLFRSPSVSMWVEMVGRMFSFQDMTISSALIDCFVLPETEFIIDAFRLSALNTAVRGLPMLFYIVTAILICTVPENNYKQANKLTISNMIISGSAFVMSLLCLSSESVFVYYNF